MGSERLLKTSRSAEPCKRQVDFFRQQKLHFWKFLVGASTESKFPSQVPSRESLGSRNVPVGRLRRSAVFFVPLSVLFHDFMNFFPFALKLCLLQSWDQNRFLRYFWPRFFNDGALWQILSVFCQILTKKLATGPRWNPWLHIDVFGGRVDFSNAFHRFFAPIELAPLLDLRFWLSLELFFYSGASEIPES